MSEPPAVEVRSGSPTEHERAAIVAAVLRLWSYDVAGSSRVDPWVLAARVEGTGRASDPLRGGDAWRRARWFSGPETRIGTGRGDAK